MSFLVDYGKFFRMAFSQNISRRLLLFGSLRYVIHPTSFVGHRFWILYQIDVKLKRASLKDNIKTYSYSFWSESSKELCNIWYNYFESKITLSSRKICFGCVSQKSRQNVPLPSPLWKNRKKHLINIWSSIYANYHIHLLSAVIFKSKFIFRPD